MGSRKTGEGVENVYEAAQKWVDCALRDDSSLFTPGVRIWSSRWLKELRERFLDQPDVAGDDFMQKLERQLRNSQPKAYQLMAEVLYIHYLFIRKGGMTAETKKKRLDTVLGWSTSPVAIPQDLVACLTPGIAHTSAFHVLIPYHVGFLIQFVEQWKEQEPSQQDILLDDPWAFKDFVMGLKLRGSLFRGHQDTPLSQRHALLHRVHPDTFEGIVSVEHKRLIARANAFAHFIPKPPDDVDARIQQIRRGLEDGLGRDFDFYDPDIRVRWDTSASDAWDEYIRPTSEFLATGKLWKDELEYKYEIGQRLASGRGAVLDNSEDWQTLVKRGITGNLIYSTQQDNLRRWMDELSNEALAALKAIWADDNSSISERIEAFCRMYPESVRSSTGGAGTRMNVVSQLLMGLDVEKYPPFMVTAFDDAYKRTGYEKPTHYNEVGLYVHALGFLDRFIEEARARGVPVRHRLDAQSLVWQVPYQEAEARGTEPPTEDDDAPVEPVDLPTLADSLHLPITFLEEIEALLEDKKQVIFQGPPGTGKTYVAQALAKHLAGSEERVTLVQLHPSYAYEDFVQGFRPTLRDGQPGFELRDGPLLRAARQARCEPDEKHFLVIDEINRGAPAKVLGELYFLLEYRDERVRLQYQRDDEEDFSLPPNLYFIGTMNTADRSIALVDLALRRRFYFVEFHPDDDPVKGVLRKWLQANAPKMKWVADVVERANVLLETDRHAAIGPSYFMKDGLDETDVERIWKHSVLSYIEERLFGEGDRVGEFDLERLRWEAGHGAVEGQGERQEGAGTDEGGGSQ